MTADHPRGSHYAETDGVVHEHQKDMADLYAYLQALFGHWIWLMSAGPFLADRTISWVSPRARSLLDNTPKRRSIFLWFAILGVFWAGYLAWSEEHAARTAADTARHNRQVVISKLTELYSRCEGLIRQIDPASFEQWAQEEVAFGNDARDWIRKNMRSGAEARFLDQGGPTYSFSSIAINQQHINALNWVNQACGNLRALIEQPNWDAP